MQKYKKARKEIFSNRKSGDKNLEGSMKRVKEKQFS